MNNLFTIEKRALIAALNVITKREAIVAVLLSISCIAGLGPPSNYEN